MTPIHVAIVDPEEQPMTTPTLKSARRASFRKPSLLHVEELGPRNLLSSMGLLHLGNLTPLVAIGHTWSDQPVASPSIAVVSNRFESPTFMVILIRQDWSPYSSGPAFSPAMRANDQALFERILSRMNADQPAAQAVRQQASADPVRDASPSAVTPAPVPGSSTPTTAQFNSRTTTAVTQDRSPELMNALPFVGPTTQNTTLPVANQPTLTRPRTFFDDLDLTLIQGGLPVIPRSTNMSLLGAAEGARTDEEIESGQEANPNAPPAQANPSFPDQTDPDQAAPAQGTPGRIIAPDRGGLESGSNDGSSEVGWDTTIWEGIRSPLDVYSVRGHHLGAALTAVALCLGTYSTAWDSRHPEVRPARRKQAPDLTGDGSEE